MQALKLGHPQLKEQLSNGEQPCQLSQVSEETCATWRLCVQPDSLMQNSPDSYPWDKNGLGNFSAS